MASLPVAFLAPGAAAFLAVTAPSAALRVVGGLPARKLDGTSELGTPRFVVALAAVAAVGGARALKRRRGVTANRVLDRAIQVIEWQVDSKTPIPGSQKAAGGMVGEEVEMDSEPGELGFDPLKLTKKSGINLKDMQLKKNKNGRLSMVGLAGMAANHALPGSVPLLTGVFYAVRPEDSSAGKAVTFCGETRAAAWKVAEMKAKTAAQYTTKKILPSLAWIKTGLKSSDLAPRQLIAKTLSGSDVLIGKTEAGKLFCVGNNCPHLGTPMSEGADVIGDVIVCPLHGSSFKTSNGELIDWCPSPPIIGPLTGLVTEKTNLAVLQVREGSGFFGGGEIEVQVDTNAKKAYEADYWKGLLDAQGKVDGTYY